MLYIVINLFVKLLFYFSFPSRISGYPENETGYPAGYKKDRIPGQPDIRYNPK